MKRIIDIDKPTFDDIIATNSIEGHFGRVDWCIRNSKPYEERPQGEWIPVSEQEPAIGGMYLVTGKNVSSGYIGIDIARRLSDNVWTFGGEELSGVEIIAWMPLPEPYKGDRE